MNNASKSPAKPAIPLLESPVYSSEVSSSPPAGGLPLLPANSSMWDGPLRLEGEVKDEEKEDDDEENHPRTPQKSSGSPFREWSPLPSPQPSPLPYRQPSPDRPRPSLPVGMRLEEIARGTLQFHNGFMEHLVDALNHSSLAHDEVCVEVNKRLITMEERALGRLNPDALRYMTSALRMPPKRQVRPQLQQKGSGGKRRSSKSPTKSERKARAKAARQASANSSSCGPGCDYHNDSGKRDDEDGPPSYAPSIPIK